jgi:hypothetical protein
VTMRHNVVGAESGVVLEMVVPNRVGRGVDRGVDRVWESVRGGELNMVGAERSVETGGGVG